MPYPNLAVAVVMECTQLDNRWQSEKWEAIGVLPDSSEPGSAPRVLQQDGLSTQWLHPGFRLELFHDEAEGYYLNLYSPHPYVFVNWLDEDGKGVPKMVTVSYNEAARQMDGGARVDGVPMPAEWIPWLAEYVERHYKPEPKGKRIRPPSFKGARRDAP
ncbi:MAG TPA: DUF3305 domain-containing protein [Burkholderiales bacterium]|nr:DUF3305 domain-containing protein [Burkholderiales bacterium]